MSSARAQASSSSSSTAPRPPSSSSSSARPPNSPPPSITSPCTATTTPAQPIHAHVLPPLQSTLPSPETQRHVSEARSAVVASLSNMVDSELQSRASILHDNAAALDRQERDVLRATEDLRREREKLAREADVAARRLKEIGNVQNWAEVLERGFLVLEETVRLANGGSDDDGESAGSSCTCSCSECGSVRGEGSVNGEDMDVDEVRSGSGGSDKGEDRRKGKSAAVLGEEADVDMIMATDSESVHGTWSDASRSLMEPESSTGTDTGRAKGSETASMSTTS